MKESRDTSTLGGLLKFLNYFSFGSGEARKHRKLERERVLRPDEAENLIEWHEVAKYYSDLGYGDAESAHEDAPDAVRKAALRLHIR